jgi:tetratricopeptide (TPR) repeat protein
MLSASLRILTTSVLSLITLLLWVSTTVAQGLSERLLDAIRQGNWQEAVTLIDLILEEDPGRAPDLQPRREEYAQRAAIDQAVAAGNWQEAIDLIDAFSQRYPDQQAALQSRRDQLSQLAEIETALQERNWYQALQLVDALIAAQPQPRPDLLRYQQQILDQVPRAGQAVQLANWTLVVAGVQDVTNQVEDSPEDQKVLLVTINAQNVGDGPQSLSPNEFSIRDVAQSYSASDATTTLTNPPRLESIATSVEPNRSLSAGLVFEVPVESESELQVLFNPEGSSERIAVIKLGL